MNNTALFILVITGALVLILGTAYAMDLRRKSTMKMEVKVPPGEQGSFMDFVWHSHNDSFIYYWSIHF
jgi:hypothetical protein